MPPQDDFRTQLLAVIPELRAFARFLARDETAADDLVQETMLKALGAQSQFNPDTNLRAWTFTILRNAHYSAWNRSRRTDTVADMGELDSDGGGAPAQEMSAMLGETYAALDTLPLAQREALVLVAAAGWSYEEAAAICGCPPGTVKSRVARARAALTQARDTAPRSRPAPRPIGGRTALERIEEEAARSRQTA